METAPETRDSNRTPQPPRKEQPKHKVGGKVLAALNKNWASLNDDVREKLQKVGFRAPQPEPEDRSNRPWKPAKISSRRRFPGSLSGHA